MLTMAGWRARAWGCVVQAGGCAGRRRNCQVRAVRLLNDWLGCYVKGWRRPDRVSSLKACGNFRHCWRKAMERWGLNGQALSGVTWGLRRCSACGCARRVVEELLHLQIM